MLKKLLFISAFLFLSIPLSWTTQAQPTTVISYKKIASYTSDDLAQTLTDIIEELGELPIPIDGILSTLGIEHDVDVYQVLYNTYHPIQGTVQASGAIAIPTNSDCEMPMIAYQHGTTFNKSGVPSLLSDEHYFGAFMASSGYAAVMPDYVGLGDSDGVMHPYVHAETQATAGIDLLRSLRELQSELNYTLTEELFLFGYSQGGHGAMALFKEIEDNYTDEFTVTAAAPMSGPYDVSGSQAKVLYQPYGHPQYLPYVVEGYRSVYPELLGGFNDIYKPPYDVLNNFTGDSDEFFAIINQINFPEIPSEIFRDDLLEEFTNNPEHPLQQALRQNDLFDWVPKAPLLILGCCDDEQVLIENSEVAFAKFQANGVEDVDMIDFCDLFSALGPFGHNGCIPFCLLWGKQFFDEHRTECVKTSIPTINDVSVNVYPNPATNWVTIEIPLMLHNEVNIRLTDITGKIAGTYTNLSPYNINFSVADLAAGMYIIDVQSDELQYQTKLLVY